MNKSTTKKIILGLGTAIVAASIAFGCNRLKPDSDHNSFVRSIKDGSVCILAEKPKTLLVTNCRVLNGTMSECPKTTVIIGENGKYMYRTQQTDINMMDIRQIESMYFEFTSQKPVRGEIQMKIENEITTFPVPQKCNFFFDGISFQPATK